MKRILIVLTNWDQLGNTGIKTGWYLPEVAHPYHVFTEAKHSVDFVSPKGGKAPMDPGSGEAFAKDPVSQAFLANKDVMNAIENTKKPSQVNARDYACIFYAGGHGPMFDMPDNQDMIKICTQIYENGGIVGAVCHGTVGLINVKSKSGQYIIKGQKVTSFTNSEEEAVKRTEAVPFPLETKLNERGADFVGAPDFVCNVVVSGKIITGQNPASATETANKIVNAL